ncbi:MAG: alpha/beta hydrolase [Melioribacteraceae bacterium]|nr:alpha/beta hydrolase [Melioribacteraceae bacterium]
MNQTEIIGKQQLAKAHTLTSQLNQKESPEITESKISGIALPFVVSFGSMMRDIFRLILKKVATSTKNARLLIIESEGHMLPIENPEKFSKIINDRLQKII